MNVELQYFRDCPHWRQAQERLLEALRCTDRGHVTVHHRRFDTLAEAEQAGFRGSPTVLLDGRDPFAGEHPVTGLSCRVYQTPEGPAGSPTVQQLIEALRPQGGPSSTS